MTNKRNNKASGTSAPKRPAQSPPSGNVQGQGSSTSTSGPTSQPLTDNSAKRTRVSSEPVMDQDNILTPPAPQDNTSTSSPLPLIPKHKGKSVEISPPEPDHAASPDASTAAIQSSPLRFYAAAAPSTIEGFWTYFKTNREACNATDREFSSFSSYGSKATTQGSGDNKIIVVYFHSKPDMEKAIAAPIASLHDLQFHEHDPSAKKADEQLRTLVVTDIPLFVTDVQLRGTFSRYGIVTHCRTRLSKLYRTAYIVFDSATSMDQFENTWAVLCTGHCLRVCPASHSPDQRAVRRAHVALLAGLPRGSVAADLSEIAEEVSAKSVNIPFSYNSYNPKPYAYVHFSSAATKESAMGSLVLSNLLALLGMNQPNNDKLRELYNKHLPPSHPAKRHNRFTRPANSEHRSYADAASRKVPSRSQSRPRSSRSRSRPNNRRHPHRPSQSELDHGIAAMDVPPLMDWQHITEQITIILEEITYLTTEFAQLQNRVKWLEDHYSSPPISRSQQPQAPPAPEIDSMNQGWDNIEPSDPRRLSDNLIDFSSPVSPSNGPNFTAHSHIPLPPRMSLIPGPATSPQDRLSSLTATVTELTKTVQQGMAQQKQFLAARDNTNSQ
ncbi:hypothetical protein RirG_196060 [Rhizophagus irregularis DAOM 197198w]|uniref:RRM domain-containing protein n=1 Tax=Rhizophagus irregularis (strain DAOM 197198w) TaxID=1432141 RepID=A0A015KGC1_RHIIW|nr:hypothetical protein RirG_196060 [Rhizophagus irregularis DAOM 197198w]